MNHDDSGDDPYVFTSVRYDAELARCAANTIAAYGSPCPIYLLEGQWNRLRGNKNAMFEDIEDDSEVGNALSSPSVFLDGIFASMRSWQKAHPSETPESLRLRIRAYSSGRLTTEMWPIAHVPLAQLFPEILDKPSEAAASATMRIVLDTEPTEPAATTMFKTSDRSAYGRARAGAGITSPAALKEVLLYSGSGLMLDASQCTPYFFRGATWVTPSVASGGQRGTTREWALATGRAGEAEIAKDSLRDGEVVWLSNAVQGFRVAIYRPE